MALFQMVKSEPRHTREGRAPRQRHNAPRMHKASFFVPIASERAYACDVPSIRDLALLWSALALTAMGFAVGYPMPFVMLVTLGLFGGLVGPQRGDGRPYRRELGGVFVIGLVAVAWNWSRRDSLVWTLAGITAFTFAEWWFSRHPPRRLKSVGRADPNA